MGSAKVHGWILLAGLVAGGCGDDGGRTDGATDGGPENTSVACRDGLDNDGDGATDCSDDECMDFVFCARADADAGDDDADGGTDGDVADSSEVDTGGEVDDTGDEAGDDVLPDDGGSCNPDPACGVVESCGDGLDNDCDGEVDEADAGCVCRHGEVQACFAGPPGNRALGGCVDGWQTCRRDETWGVCEEGLWPADEVPDGKDNDCDGCVDEGLATTPTVQCPDVLDAVLGKWHVLRCEDLCVPAGSTTCDCS